MRPKGKESKTMGYNTSYNGAFKIEPPLTKQKYHRLSQVVPFWNSEDIKQRAISVFEAGLTQLTPEDQKLFTSEQHWFTFTLEPDQIIANEESVKAYYEEEAFAVAAQWLTDNGHQLSGEATWSGDESEDTGTIYAAFRDGKNCVEFVRDVHHNPGPSWEKQPTTFTDAQLASMVRGSCYMSNSEFADGADRFLVVLAVPYGTDEEVTTVRGALESFRELLTADDWEERSFQVYDHADGSFHQVQVETL
jgi:hypothetical protein